MRAIFLNYRFIQIGVPLWFVFLIASCASPTGSDRGEAGEVAEKKPENPQCPTQSPPSSSIPHIRPEERTVEYWLQQQSKLYDLDEVLLSRERIASLNKAATLPSPDEDRDALNFDLSEPYDQKVMREELQERLSWMRDKLESGEYVTQNGQSATEGLLAKFSFHDSMTWKRELRVVQDGVMLHCGPTQKNLYTQPVNLDVSRNHCSYVEPGEPLQVVAEDHGLLLVLTRFTFGWIPTDASLSAPLSEEQTKAYLSGRRMTLDAPLTYAGKNGTIYKMPTGVELRIVPGSGGESAWVPSGEQGLRQVPIPQENSSEESRLTRRNVLKAAFHMLDKPYGWGGQEGGVDCSRFLLELFEGFGVELPRFSGNQPLASSFRIDVTDIEDTEQKRLLIDAAADKGIVLLQMSGHIMLYLGRNEDGEQRAIHSFAEYLKACPEGERNIEGKAHTLHHVGRVDISGLKLGEGTERTSFIERISHIAVIGHPRSFELRGVAEPRKAAPVAVPDAENCKDHETSAIFTTPMRAHEQGAMQIIHVASEAPGPAGLVAVSPSGERHELDVELRGGPPFTAIAEIEHPESGTWTLVYGDGKVVHACEQVFVRSAPAPDHGGSGPVWNVRNQWSPQFENLYSAWVEKLFSYPLEQDITWNNLQSVLQNQEKNLLYNYASSKAEESLHLQPDCADLPYMLRAYFAWRLGLPFGYRRCSRGREGHPPMCGDVLTNLQERSRTNHADAFEHFSRVGVMNSVHSGSGRTVPSNNETDYYPVPLSRKTVRPGITYIDPDGHLLVVAGWTPQTPGSPGTLYAADAQPDGTIGRRRFWRGSFLFRPQTDSVGAGFKAFRPLVYDPRSRTLTPVPNKQLTESSTYIPYSDEQNRGTKNEFYEKVEAMENPLPVKPEIVQLSLVEAFEESVARRVDSVENCEEYMRNNHDQTVEMPHGYHIFETSGAWENYSTPARDMRLLISLDTVLGFVDTVRDNPKRFGIQPQNVEERVQAIEAYRDKQLSERTFTYQRSDGSSYSLTLKDVTDRIESFEMSYNPNDCPEIRWAAPEGSDELSTCDRHAPDAQRQRMRQYRPWFDARQRPAR